MVSVFLSFLGIRGKMALLVSKNFLGFSSVPDDSPVAEVPNSLAVGCLLLQTRAKQTTV